jgi:hypothetical protein
MNETMMRNILILTGAIACISGEVSHASEPMVDINRRYIFPKLDRDSLSNYALTNKENFAIVQQYRTDHIPKRAVFSAPSAQEADQIFLALKMGDQSEWKLSGGDGIPLKKSKLRDISVSFSSSEKESITCIYFCKHSTSQCFSITRPLKKAHSG